MDKGWFSRLLGREPERVAEAKEPEPALPEPAQAIIETVEVYEEPDEDDEEAERPKSEAFRKFDAFMDAKVRDCDGKWLSATIAGTTHRNEDGTSRQQYVRELAPYTELTLERDPHNEFSKHAVKVLIEGRQLGFLPDWLARDVGEAIDSGGVAACFVQHIRQTSSTNWTAAIGAVWKAKRSPRTEFRSMIDNRSDVEEWFWAKLSRTDGLERQAAIEGLTTGDVLTIDEDDAGRVVLKDVLNEEVATLSKHQQETVRAGLDDSRKFEAIVFEVREKVKGHGLEPVVAVLLLKRE